MVNVCLLTFSGYFFVALLLPFFNWISLHGRLNSTNQVWSYQKKKKKSLKRIQESCLERVRIKTVTTYSKITATQIIGQRKALCRQRIPEFNSARKETDRHPWNIWERYLKNHASYQNNEWTYLFYLPVAATVKIKQSKTA